MKININKILLLAAKDGMNKTMLAKKIGMSRQNLSTVISRKTCSAKTVLSLCSALGVEPDELIIPEPTDQ